MDQIISFGVIKEHIYAILRLQNVGCYVGWSLYTNEDKDKKRSFEAKASKWIDRNKGKESASKLQGHQYSSLRFKFDRVQLNFNLHNSEWNLGQVENYSWRDFPSQGIEDSISLQSIRDVQNTTKWEHNILVWPIHNNC